MSKRLFTSESVTEGHPDKLCDQISDSILDTILSNDPSARVACETIATTGMVFVTGEITTNCYADIPSIVRKTIKDVGYDNSAYGFDYKSCAVLTSIDEQSPDIALGVDASDEYKVSDVDRYDITGAGDQGMMFGFACDETPELMPAPIAYAHLLARRMSELRKDGTLPFLRPDGKTQITILYDESGNVKGIDTVVVSSQHSPDIELGDLRSEIKSRLILPTLPEKLLTADTKFYINPTGRFVLGGPPADSGLTGRKIVVDTYGGYARHGGGAFSGKDPTKVDRSATYMARCAAKNVVAAGLARRCEIQVSYAIGVARPVSFFIDTFGTGKMDDEKIAALVNEKFDFRPASIIEQLGLRRPIYRQVASYGHFGRPDLDLPWEKVGILG
ncbi:MAG: methionine adenosyltransferase [Clostridiales bacterium]|jgi:S-adenosylmethionine synthetase|nr:methionine adenosyltransferase [Clostridiales bacterium]